MAIKTDGKTFKIKTNPTPKFTVVWGGEPGECGIWHKETGEQAVGSWELQKRGLSSWQVARWSDAAIEKLVRSFPHSVNSRW